MQRAKEIRNEFPKMKWPEILQKLNLPKGFKTTYKALRQKFAYFVSNQKVGTWTVEEEGLFHSEYLKHGTSWSRYDIPGRTPVSIRNKFINILKGQMKNLKSKSVAALLIKALEDGINEEIMMSTKYRLVNCYSTLNRMHTIV